MITQWAPLNGITDNGINQLIKSNWLIWQVPNIYFLLNLGWSSFGYCYHLFIVIIRLLLSFGYCYHLVNVIIWLLLSFGYCYHSVIVIIQLLLSFGYCYHLVIVIIRLLLSFGYCYHSVNGISYGLAQSDPIKWCPL
jgi:hypothetical protein